MGKFTDSLKEWWDDAGKSAEDWAKVGKFVSDVKTKAKVTNYNQSEKIADLRALYNQVKEDHKSSVFAQLKPYDLAGAIVEYSLAKSGKNGNEQLVEPFFDAVLDLATDECFFGITEMDWNREIPLSEQIETRKFLLSVQSRFQDGADYLETWAETMIEVFVTVLGNLPATPRNLESSRSFAVPLMYLLQKPEYTVEQVVLCFFQKNLDQGGMFEDIRGRLNYNARIVSGIDPENPEDTRKPLLYPTDSKLEGIELSTAYFRGTVFEEIFRSPYPVSIPIDLRLEHTHILAGTGHGKTQLIQSLILDDINAGRGFCVIDSQGDLIRNITMLAEFDPKVAESLAEKIIIIDPTDTDFPACLNMFAMSKGVGTESSSLQKELVLNATVDLYSYIFGALFGSELTSKQGTVFAYIARLMIEIPDANIQTLRELMEDGRKFLPYMENLTGSARAFFKTQFFTTTYGQSKLQVLTRLWSVLSNATLERMFSNTENKVDVLEAINSGKILLVNTSKELLQRDGSAILGRFFIALISQAVIKRSGISEDMRNPFMVYIDEAHEYFDFRLEDILNQARKYKVGFTLAHQNLDQLHGLKATVASSTSVKLAGGVSSSDAQTMARDMRSSTEEIMSVTKGTESTEFACFLKNITSGVLPIEVPFGQLEEKKVMSMESYGSLIDKNRENHCNHVSEVYLGSEDNEPFSPKFGKVSSTPSSVEKKTVYKGEPKTRETVAEKQAKEVSQVEESIADSKTDLPSKPPKSPLKKPKHEKEGKGGSNHKYLQNLVRKLAHQRGYKVSLEKQVLSGTGAIDAYIEGYDKSIAVEISSTTGWKWEASNISKCLAAGSDEVIVLASDQKHLNELRNNLDSEFLGNNNILYFNPDDLISHLDQIRASASNKEKTVRGYKVKVRYSATGKNEAEEKKEAIVKLLMNARNQP